MIDLDAIKKRLEFLNAEHHRIEALADGAFVCATDTTTGWPCITAWAAAEMAELVAEVERLRAALCDSALVLQPTTASAEDAHHVVLLDDGDVHALTDGQLNEWIYGGCLFHYLFDRREAGL